MSDIQFLVRMIGLSWRMTRNETPLRVFLSTFGIRILFQSVFFIWIARVIGGDAWMRFALYGNVLLPAVQFLFVDVFNVLKEEIDEQRLGLLTASATPLLSTLIGRTLGYVLKTFLIILFTYSVIGLFALRDIQHWLNFIEALPLVFVFVLSGYAVAVFLSAFNLRETIAQMLPNLSIMLLMLLGDFNIPVSAFPRPLQVVSGLLPLRHAVDAFRSFMVDQVPYWTNPALYEELLLMIVYATVGYGVYLRTLRKSRQTQVG